MCIWFRLELLKPILIKILINMHPTFSREILWYWNFEFSFSDIADGLVGVGLITQDDNNPGHLTLDKGYNDMSKFLNRILGMNVNLQNMLFKYFTDTLNKIIDNVSVFFIYPYNNFFFKSMNIVLCLRSENLESNSWGPQFFL